MERIAIIDHAAHNLYIEDIYDEILESPEWDGEEAYIKENYTFEGEWSWDYITNAQYFPNVDYGNPNISIDVPIEINFEDIADI